MQISAGEVAEVLCCYYSQDSHEIVRKFSCVEVAKFADHDWTFWDVFARGPMWTFSDSVPYKGLILSALEVQGARQFPLTEIASR